MTQASTDPLYDSRNPNHGRSGGLRDEPQSSVSLAEAAIERQKAIKPDADALAKDLVAAGESEYAAGEPQTPSIQLQARPAEGGDWTDIFPAQLQWMAKEGHEVRAIEQCSEDTSHEPHP